MKHFSYKTFIMVFATNHSQIPTKLY